MYSQLVSLNCSFRGLLFLVLAVTVGLPAPGFGDSLRWQHPKAGEEVEAKRALGQPWKNYKATRYADVLGATVSNAEVTLSPFGGRLDQQVEATGFFRVEMIEGRWWMIDPRGHPTVHVGIGAVYRKGFDQLAESRQAELGFKDDAVWANSVADLARTHRFTATGRWSENDVLKKANERLPYTTSLSVMANFARSLEVTYAKYGHAGYDGGVIPVFHPDFPAHAKAYAQKNLAESINDPYLVGHYLDNELPVSRKTLDLALGLDRKHPVYRYQYKEAWSWLRDKYGRRAKADQATAEDNMAFLGHVMETYYRIAAEAVREADPNHLILGSRLHAAGHKMPPVIAAAGRHCDVISINLYSVWEPNADQMAMWREAGQAPVLISEFYIRGVDAGLPDDKGAGGTVRTQAQRAAWYENFTLQLLRSGGCIGWDYFKYRDDTDQNKGILQHDWKPYPEFNEPLGRANALIHPLIDRFDATAASAGFGDADNWSPTKGSKLKVMGEER